MTVTSVAEPQTLRERVGSMFAQEDRVILMDYLLLILAFASAIILFLEWNVELPPNQEAILTLVDRVAIGLFALGFMGKVLTSPEPGHTLKTRAVELIGLFPLTQPVLVDPTYYPIVQGLALITRFSIGLDRHLGDRALSRIFQRYRSMIVEELTDPILIRASIITEDVIQKGTYAQSIGENLEEKRPQVHETVLKSIEANPKARRLMKIPGIPGLVRDAVDGALDSTVTALTADEMEEIVESTVAEVFKDFRREVGRKEWKTKGVGVGTVIPTVRRGRGDEDDQFAS